MEISDGIISNLVNETICVSFDESKLEEKRFQLEDDAQYKRAHENVMEQGFAQYRNFEVTSMYYSIQETKII